MDELIKQLEAFCESRKITSKGPLCVMLVVTQNAREKTFPLVESDFLVPNRGQVAGLGKNAVQKILKKHNIIHILAEEGGRTSRGSIEHMKSYLTFLNELHEQNLLEWPFIETFWIERTNAFFASKPFHIKIDSAKSLKNMVHELMRDVNERQKKQTGTMYAGAVMQHLTAAKLQIALPDVEFEVHGFSSADQPTNRKGDFLIGETVIHVTTTPSEALLRKCNSNLGQNLKPLIITSLKGVGTAEGLAENISISDRIDVFEFEQFVATNLFELGRGKKVQVNVSINDLIGRYNAIIEKVETDKSLLIELV
jgi:hypothetical protein